MAPRRERKKHIGATKIDESFGIFQMSWKPHMVNIAKKFDDETSSATCFITPVSSPRYFSSAVSEASDGLAGEERPQHSDAVHNQAVTAKRNVSCSFQVGIEEDAAFRVVKRLIGKNGKHMKRIERECEDAVVQLCGRRNSKQDSADGPLVLRLSAGSMSSLEKARSSAASLLARVHDEYREFCASQGKPEPCLEVKCDDQHIV
jgi:hypothetical protein